MKRNKSLDILKVHFNFSFIVNTIVYIVVHFHTGAEVDYLPHVMFLWRKVHEVKRTSLEPYFIPRAPKSHIKVVILRLEKYVMTYNTKSSVYIEMIIRLIIS